MQHRLRAPLLAHFVGTHDRLADCAAAVEFDAGVSSALYARGLAASLLGLFHFPASYGSTQEAQVFQARALDGRKGNRGIRFKGRAYARGDCGPCGPLPLPGAPLGVAHPEMSRSRIASFISRLGGRSFRCSAGSGLESCPCWCPRSACPWSRASAPRPGDVSPRCFLGRLAPRVLRSAKRTRPRRHQRSRQRTTTPCGSVSSTWDLRCSGAALGCRSASLLAR